MIKPRKGLFLLEGALTFMAESQRKLDQDSRLLVARLAAMRKGHRRKHRLEVIALNFHISMALIFKIEAEFNFKKPIDNYKEKYRLEKLKRIGANNGQANIRSGLQPV